MELIFDPCGEFRWSPEDSVGQIHFPLLHVGAPGSFQIFYGLFRCQRESGVRKQREGYRTYSIPGKTAALVSEFAVEDLPSVELQPWFLPLQWRTCPWAEHSDVDDPSILISVFFTEFCYFSYEITTQLSSWCRMNSVPDLIFSEKFLGYNWGSNPGPLRRQSDIQY